MSTRFAQLVIYTVYIKKKYKKVALSLRTKCQSVSRAKYIALFGIKGLIVNTISFVCFVRHLTTTFLFDLLEL